MTDWDKLSTSAAINKLAATVTSGSSETYEPKKLFAQDQAGHVHDTAPPPYQAAPGKFPWTENLVGQSFGRLRVLGKFTGRIGKHGGARWVVRCTCGAHEVRRAKALKSGTTSMCSACHRLEDLKSGAYQRGKAAKETANGT